MATSQASGSSGHILLVGMMGAGKTSVGERLADRLGRPFFDVDAWIENEEGMSISAIFQARGEAAFRDLEAGTLAMLLTNPVASVLSVGGGAVTQAANRAALKSQQQVVWLRAMGATLASRIGNGSDRPLLAGKDVVVELGRISKARDGMYGEVADAVVDVDNLSVDEVVDSVVAALE